MTSVNSSFFFFIGAFIKPAIVLGGYTNAEDG